MEGDQQVWGWRRGQGSPSHLGRSAIGGGQSLCFCLPVKVSLLACSVGALAKLGCGGEARGKTHAKIV